MNTRGEFPQYYHVEDLYGNVFAVVCKEADTDFTVIQKRDVRKSFVVSKVTSEAAVKDIAPGQLLGCSIDDYQDVLDREFGFKLSIAALNAKLQPEEQNDGQKEKSVIEDTNASTSPGTDVQSPSGSNAGEERKSPESPDATPAPDNVADDTNGDGSAGIAGEGDKSAKTKQTNDSGSDPKPVHDSGGKQPEAKKDIGSDGSKSNGITKKK